MDQERPLDPIDLDTWRCPGCRGRLHGAGDRLACGECSGTYPVFGGIPDFRPASLSGIDWERDRERAEELLPRLERISAAEALRQAYAALPVLTPERVELRTVQVLAGSRALRADVRGWLAETLSAAPFLDLGCGPGQLLAAASLEGRPGVGIDIGLEWLLIAQKVIREAGGRPVLAAACAEALPLETGRWGAVVALDVIEHVDDPSAMLREVDRVLTPEGRFALATPNRFSLAPETHTGVWGVGFLPRRFQEPYVRWRARRDYDVRLLGASDIARMLREHTGLRPRIHAPPIPEREILRFGPTRSLIGRVYNASLRVAPARWFWLRFGAFLRVVAAKRPGRAP